VFNFCGESCDLGVKEWTWKSFETGKRCPSDHWCEKPGEVEKNLRFDEKSGNCGRKVGEMYDFWKIALVELL